jgi:hypothetical protein
MHVSLDDRAGAPLLSMEYSSVQLCCNARRFSPSNCPLSRRFDYCARQYRAFLSIVLRISMSFPTSKTVVISHSHLTNIEGDQINYTTRE